MLWFWFLHLISDPRRWDQLIQDRSPELYLQYQNTAAPSCSLCLFHNEPDYLCRITQKEKQVVLFFLFLSQCLDSNWKTMSFFSLILFLPISKPKSSSFSTPRLFSFVKNFLKKTKGFFLPIQAFTTHGKHLMFNVLVNSQRGFASSDLRFQGRTSSDKSKRQPSFVPH